MVSTSILYAGTSTNKKLPISSNTLLKKADIAYNTARFAVAVVYYETYMHNHSDDKPEILSKLADCYWQMREYDNAFRIYKSLYPNTSNSQNQQIKYRIAELYARYGLYQQASDWLKDVPGHQLKAKLYKNKNALNKMKKDSLEWKLVYLNINTPYREFSPFMANNSLFFSSNKPLTHKTKSFGWDGENYAHLWEIQLSNIDTTESKTIQNNHLTKSISRQKTNQLAGIYECGDTKSSISFNRSMQNETTINADLKPVGKTVNGLDNMLFNAGSISIDKNNHFYFSANYTKADKNGVNRICIMEGILSPSGITNIQRLTFGDANAYSVMHPAINSDGTLLVLSSDKTNGKGGYDLYYSLWNEMNQSWDTLKALGNNINTIGNEVFPSITPNGYLYFSSDNLPGLGGLDIFRIPIQDALNGKGEIEHLSYPVNSSADDFGWTQQDSVGLKGFFTSDRLNNDDNIYSFTYNPVKSVIPPRKSFFEGFVLEKQSLKLIAGATVFLYNIKEDTVYIAKTDKTGKYHLPVRTTSEVIIKAVDKKYISDCISTSIVFAPHPKDTIQNAPRDLLLDKFKVGFKWKLSNIHYDFDKWNIRADAAPILDSVVMILNENPITIELGSHTDSRGSFKYNERLSQHRAESAAAYLIQHGINTQRITAKGYGEYQLLNRCSDGVPCSDAEHQANRRTEVKVTGYTTPQKVSESINPDKFKDKSVINKNQLPTDFFEGCKLP